MFQSEIVKNSRVLYCYERMLGTKENPLVLSYEGACFTNRSSGLFPTSLPLTSDKLYSIFTNTPYRNPRVLAVHWPEPKNFRLSSRINAPIGKMSARLG